MTKQKKLNARSDSSETWIDKDLQRCQKKIATKNNNFSTNILGQEEFAGQVFFYLARLASSSLNHLA